MRVRLTVTATSMAAPRGTVLAKLMPPLAVALALTGCGIQAATPPGGVSLTVTRDFGAGPVLDQPSPRRGGDDTVLRLLRRNASVRTRGGGSVASIDGLAGVWSAYVNGVAASRRAGDVHVHEGDRIWLDRHAAPADARVRAVVGAFPEPFLHGSGGKRLPVRVECGSGARPACRAVADALGKAGVVAGQSALGPGVGPEVLRVLVGPWGALRA